jgi:hypothetical protein
VASEATGMVALPRVLSASTSNSGKPTLDKKQQPVTEDSLNLIEEVLNFQTNCPNCGAPAETKMKVTSEFMFFIILHVWTIRVLTENSKGVFSKPSGNLIVAPIFCFLS